MREKTFYESKEEGEVSSSEEDERDTVVETLAAEFLRRQKDELLKPRFWESEDEIAHEKKRKEEKLAKKLEEKKFENPEPKAEVEERQKATETAID